MSAAAAAAPSTRKVLRRLFLTLFLRGRSARGLRKGGAPGSIAAKLWRILLLYAFIGLAALGFRGRPVLELALYLHAMTFAFLGMFVAASAGEMLFNKEEADILLHRPVDPRALLWAKIAVLVQVSAWLAGAFNLVGCLVGLGSPDARWFFPLVHAASAAVLALLCTGTVVLGYQLCLRWAGRERLESVMSTAQTLVAVAMVLAGQIVPQVARLGQGVRVDVHTWWITLLPPTWFAGFDDALAGSGGPTSWVLAAVGLVVAAAVLRLSFGRLARDYEAGLQRLGETSTRPPAGARGRSLARLLKSPLARWWLRAPVARVTFLLIAAYLVRDRDVKLRVYPGLAPFLVMPVVFLLQSYGRRGETGLNTFIIALVGCYLSLIPMTALVLLRHSQQWAAADLFRMVPLPGPGPLSLASRRAVLWVLTGPIVLGLGLLLWRFGGPPARLLLLLPGLIALPVLSLVPCLGGQAVPLSAPVEEARAAGRGPKTMGLMVGVLLMAGLSTWAWNAGRFRELLGVEVAVAIVAGLVLKARVAAARWPALE